MGLEGDLGEGMCVMGKRDSGPYVSEIHLLFLVMQIDEKNARAGKLVDGKK